MHRFTGIQLKGRAVGVFRKILLLVFVSVYLFSIAVSVQSNVVVTTGLQEASASQFEDWMYRKTLVLNETAGINRVNEPVDCHIILEDGECANASKEIRVSTEESVEIPSQVYNVTKYGSGYTKSCNVVFQANVTANSEAMYYIYYGNPSATKPTYATDISAEATDTNITVWNTYYKASFMYIQIGISDTMQYLYYKPYSTTLSLGRADWHQLFQTIINIDPYWYGPFPAGKPIAGTNVTVEGAGPIFIEVKAVYGDWKRAGVNSLVKTYRFYSNLPWFTISSDFNLTGATYQHIQTEAYISREAFPFATYRKADGSLTTIGIAPSQGDFLDWNGTWIDAETKNTTDNPIGMAFITMPGTNPSFTGFRSDQSAIAPFQNGSLLAASQNLAILLHQGNYLAAEQLYKAISHPLTIYLGPEIVPPVADAGNNQTVDVNTLVTFNGSGSFDNVGVTSYTWTFTDVTPKTLTGVNPTYNFTTPGTYVVTLNVTDAAGNWDTDTVTITVVDLIVPVADAGSNQTVKVGEPIVFNASGSTDNVGIVNYTWDFGDGNTTSLADPIMYHTYNTTGTYTVTLTVMDAAGNSATDTTTVIIEVAPTPLWAILAIVAGTSVIMVSAAVILARRKSPHS